MAEIKQPEDRKPKSEPFVWTSPDGRTVTLQPFDRVPAGVFRKMRGLDEMQLTFGLLEAATDDEGLSVVDDLPLGDLDQLFDAWTQAAGVEIPQS